MKAGNSMRVEIHDKESRRVVLVNGRDAWALHELTLACAAGYIFIGHPGPRWSSYVSNLRQLGIQIESMRERHGGIFAGRDVLRAVVRIPHNVHANPQIAGSRGAPPLLVRAGGHHHGV